jgi:hypothetical protein
MQSSERTYGWDEEWWISVVNIADDGGLEPSTNADVLGF